MRRIVAAIAITITAFVTAPASAVTDDALRRVDQQRVLFGHQSVGWNILDGVNTLYGRRGITAPDVVDELPGSGPGFAQVEIGSNGDPASKIADFEQAIADQDPQVAVMKLCFVDITTGTKARAVFAQYQQMVARVGQTNPGTRLLHMTVPLTVNDPASNAVRQRYNALVRKTYGTDVIDIAKIESTRPNGSRGGGTRHPALWRGYASDDGHLNTRGSVKVAKTFLAALAR